jgi:hypothetical protein
MIIMARFHPDSDRDKLWPLKISQTQEIILD